MRRRQGRARQDCDRHRPSRTFASAARSGCSGAGSHCGHYCASSAGSRVAGQPGCEGQVVRLPDATTNACTGLRTSAGTSPSRAIPVVPPISERKSPTSTSCRSSGTRSPGQRPPATTSSVCSRLRRPARRPAPVRQPHRLSAGDLAVGPPSANAPARRGTRDAERSGTLRSWTCRLPPEQEATATMSFDNTIDNRYRPDRESSRLRVHDEEREANEPPVIYSRELSFVPARRPGFAGHDAQTQALIERYARLERMPHGERLSPKLEDWRFMDAMKSPEEKQRYLEPMIEAVRRDLVAHENASWSSCCWSSSRSAARSAARSWKRAPGWTRRSPTSTGATAPRRACCKRSTRQDLYDVTRAGAIEAIFRYPSTRPETAVPVGARDDRAPHARSPARRAARRSRPAAPTPPRPRRCRPRWPGSSRPNRRRCATAPGCANGAPGSRCATSTRSSTSTSRRAPSPTSAGSAMGRLPAGQRAVIDGVLLPAGHVPRNWPPAAASARARSTTPNVRPRRASEPTTASSSGSTGSASSATAREARALAERYPDGRLPDGRRIVHIDLAA